MWAFFRKAGGSMSGEATPYKPSHWPQENVLSTELRRHGNRAAAKRLAKACQGAVPATRSAAERSKIWTSYKGWGAKKNKLAIAIMALEYDRMVEEVDKMAQLVQKLQVKARPQEDEVASLRNQLQNQVQHNKQLKGDLQEAQIIQQQTKAEMRSKDDEVERLRQEVASLRNQFQNQVHQNKELKGDLEVAQIIQERTKAEMWSKDDEVERLRQEVASLRNQFQNQVHQNKELKSDMEVVLSNQQQIEDASIKLFTNIELLNSLPDLEKNNYNYDFWKKIREFCIMGVNAKQIFRLVQAKWPKNEMQTLMDLRASDMYLANNSSTSNGEALLQIFRWSVTSALGSGMECYHVYKNRSQKEGESFESYSKEKFKLYCAYGDEEPDINDKEFIDDLLENAHKKYRDLRLNPITTHDALMSSVAHKDRLLACNWTNRCKNCENYGHDWESCRRPGGGDEVPPGVCYTCGMSGHLARNCWHYQDD
ncbi:uncharacterized protein LOC143518403 [Brachyhypopomus gauderio]|uniref:uncharacterized protein LOC143518403 n=1 Tax=Brachyhypopomus gauderio TaxID=698409 RepID=UPI0040414C2D